MKAARWVILSFGGLIVIAAAAVGFLVATFDPNDYKPWVIARVKQETGRTLTVDGRIGLALFPRIGATVGKVTLSEPDSPAIFARVDEARVTVALLPLLTKRVVVERVILNGLAVDLVRFKDGHTNFDDLTGRTGPSAETPGGRPPGPPLLIDVAGVEIHGATIDWRDEVSGTNMHIADAVVKTGRLAPGAPGTLEMTARVQGVQPKVALQVEVTAGYRLAHAAPPIALSALTTRARGDAWGITGIDARITSQAVDVDAAAGRATASGLELTVRTKAGLDGKVTLPHLVIAPDRAETAAMSVEGALSTSSRSASARLHIAPLAVRGRHVEISRVDAELTAKEGDLSLHGVLTTPVTLDLGTWQAQLSRIAAEMRVSGRSIPDGTRATVRGAAQADWSAESAAAELSVVLDTSKVDARIAVAHWSAPDVTFNVVADRLDLDRSFASSRAGPAPGGGSTGGEASTERPFDLSPLASVNMAGQVRIGVLRASGLRAEQVAVAVKAAGGRLDLNPISATLYQGTLAGSVAIGASDSSVVVKQRLTGINLGPLLQDVASKDVLEGRGALVLDVRTSGTTVTALKKALAGTAHIALKDGAIKGVDLTATLRTAQTLLGAKGWLEQKAQGGAATDFAELTASFLVKNGVAHSDDLQMSSPALRLTGRGDVDIGEGTLNFTTRVSVTAAVTSLGGKDLAQLVGVAVPLRATGPLANPTYGVDVQSLAAELARTTLQREIERRLGTGKSGGQPPGGAVGDVLRGIFGRPK